LHDVGTLKTGSGQRLADTLRGLDTPSLLGVWEKPVLLHDGSASSLMEVITIANPADRHGRTSHLTLREKEDLVAFLNQIEGGAPADGIQRRTVAGSPLADVRASRFGSGYRFKWRISGANAGARMRIFDGSGRLVREMVSAATPNGGLEFLWDGRGRHGATAKAGIYQVRLDFATGSSARSLYLEPR
jgi:hypothetical protein